MEINKNIDRAITEMGFTDFTEIQEKTIPLLLDGKDVIGHSQTGTGKTAAFGIPILNSIDTSSRDVQALILCPTRELAVQVKDELLRMAKYMKDVKITAVYGGDPIHRQITQLKKKPQIIVGTPGRTIDHINRKLLRLTNIKYMVLDEADEMLKMGFKEDIETILESANHDRQNLMFSATMPRPILNIAKKFMKDPEVVTVVSGPQTNKDIIQYYYQVSPANKTEATTRLINVYNPKLTLVFCNTKRQVDKLTEDLIQKGFNVDKIHGDLPQTVRMDTLKKFQKGIVEILVATDVAARGLDIKAVEAVINYDLPEKADYYVHRIGRTGRIGASGYSFSLVTKREVQQLNEIFNKTGAVIKKRSIPSFDKVKDIKDEKIIESIVEVVKANGLDDFRVIAQRLMVDNDPVEVISALLKITARNDDSHQVNKDLNEDFTFKRNSRNQTRGPRDSSLQSNQIRFHLNIGKKLGVGPKELVEYICKNSSVRDREVKDVTVRNEFSFFTVSKKHEKELMTKLKNQKFRSKKVSLQEAKGR